jgi:hypothetical protein
MKKKAIYLQRGNQHLVGPRLGILGMNRPTARQDPRLIIWKWKRVSDKPNVGITHQKFCTLFNKAVTRGKE